jgi:hypothetical protein
VKRLRALEAAALGRGERQKEAVARAANLILRRASGRVSNIAKKGPHDSPGEL